MLSCKDVSAIVASGELQHASTWRRINIKFHLMMCQACRHFVDQVEDIRQASRRLVYNDTASGLSPEAKQRITEKLQKPTSNHGE